MTAGLKRVAVTGMGVVSPLGNTLPELVTALRVGRSAIRRIAPDACPRLRTRITAPCEFDGAPLFAGPRRRMLDRSSQLALAATQSALASARLSADDLRTAHAGAAVGTGMGGSPTTDCAYHALYGEQADRLPPFTVLMAMSNAAAAWIALDHGITGPTLTYSTACSSSTVAIGEAMRRIQSGETEVMIAGGTEAPLSPGPMMAWDALQTLAREDATDPAASCKPFSANRSGMVLGEGAAMVVLEEWSHAQRRGATILAELAGYGLATDVVHLTRPSEAGQAAAMQKALLDAALPPDAIGYVNAHGTGTLANDVTETRAIRQVFGASANRLPVSSTKSMHGHLLGGSGALEFIIALLAMREQFLPPTMHLDQSDPECDLDYVPNAARPSGPIDAVMSNSFAFGGTNAVLIARAV